MTPATPFVLTGPSGTLVAQGIRNSYDDVAAAGAALRDGSAGLVVGALPFDPRDPAALLAPERVAHTLPPAPDSPLPKVRVAAALPDVATHRARVEAALHRLRDPENPLRKVVLARSLQLAADGPLDPLAILHRLVDADPESFAYLADLSPAGPAHTGTALVGASPELLVARRGEEVTCRPFAGSAPRSADPRADDAAGAALAASAK
ncbi:MAG: chorismate-binding protein, partial [Mycobacterium sp.]